jgi:hypothetical protein
MVNCSEMAKTFATFIGFNNRLNAERIALPPRVKVRDGYAVATRSHSSWVTHSQVQQNCRENKRIQNATALCSVHEHYRCGQPLPASIGQPGLWLLNVQQCLLLHIIQSITAEGLSRSNTKSAVLTGPGAVGM